MRTQQLLQILRTAYLAYQGLKAWEKRLVLSVPVLLIIVAIIRSDDPNETITAWGTLLAALASTAAVVFAAFTFRNEVERASRERRDAQEESERARVVAQVDLISRLWDQFNSDSFREIRRRSATYVNNQLPTPVGQSVDINDPAVADIINFFENVGFLVRTQALDAALVWERFHIWIVIYWRLCEGGIEDQRQTQEQPWAWRDFKFIADVMDELRERHSARYEMPFQTRTVFMKAHEQTFLNAEMSLP